jgi:trans-aconitate methyltransferase
MVAPRIAHTIALLDVQPGDRVLEIGPGHGVALDLIAQRLDGGVAVGLDRSAKMIAAAAKRNRGHIDACRVRLIEGAIEAWQPDEQFDLVFAIHVRAFVEPDHPAWGPVRSAIVPGGRFAVSFQPLDPGDVERLGHRFRQAFKANGLAGIRHDVSDPGEGPVVVVIGTAPV